MSLTLKFKKNYINSYDLLFALLLFGGLIFIASSFPMMKLRFDIWQHIDHIYEYVKNPNDVVTSRAAWLKLWAFIFRLLGVDDIFAFATVIHRTQFLLNCIVVYYAAKLIFSALIKFDVKEPIKLKNQWISSFALSSVFVWLTIIGTYSFFQQAWIMWYSVNYQITLSLLFLSLALGVNAVSVEQSKLSIAVKACSAFLLILSIYLFHAGELAYLFIYIFIGFACFGYRLKLNLKYAVLAFALLSLIVYVLVKMYSDHVPAIITLLKDGQYAQILTDLQEKGKWNAIDGGNRYAANWNELYRLSIYACVPMLILAYLNPLLVNKKVLYFIVASLIFCFLPTFQYSAGIVSLISYAGIVNRYYYASLIFLILPLLVYLILKKYNIAKYPFSIVIIVLSIMSLVLIYSKKINHEGVYFQNIQSIKNSIRTNQVDIGISRNSISRIETQVRNAESKAVDTKYIFCGSFEDLYVVRYVFHKKNMLFDRLGNYSVADCESYAKSFSKKIVYLE